MEKSYEERLQSLKTGCTIFGVFEGLCAVLFLFTGNIAGLIFAIAYIVMLYYIYKFTAERNPSGPTLETVFGALLIINGIYYCITILLLLLGVIYIIFGIGVLNEAKYFRSEIDGPIPGQTVNPNEPPAPTDTVSGSEVDAVFTPEDDPIKNTDNNNTDL